MISSLLFPVEHLMPVSNVGKSKVDGNFIYIYILSYQKGSSISNPSQPTTREKGEFLG
jgi:hypothetical protein